MAEKNLYINSISIKNFKSIVNSTIQLSGFTVFIGANGCGKSNILEAIALSAAASANKLDYEYFANRGIRVTEPIYMMPMFNDFKRNSIDLIIIDSAKRNYTFKISYNKEKWYYKLYTQEHNLAEQTNAPEDETNNLLNQMNKELSDLAKEYNHTEINDYIIHKIDKIKKEYKSKIENYFLHQIPITTLNNFLIFSLEESKLRKADASNRTYPLGIHGEGLFAYLKEVSKSENASDFFNELKENLMVFDWFEEIEIPNGQLSNEFNIQLKDSYLYETLNTFDQRSTNEGFLYLLFYLTLIISDKTPKFFAIENIDASFNPKLCREVIKRLIVLAKKHGKQIIATTHNPSVLDGLDLEDDDECLYTIRRTIDGDTKASQVTLKGKLTIPLSEAWQRGYIGGLPDNF